ncbi:MAG: hypothetical protein WBJ65_13440, partial [Candidatus Microthrix parvicella]
GHDPAASPAGKPPDLTLENSFHAETVEVPPAAYRPAVDRPGGPSARAPQKRSGVANIEDHGATPDGHIGDGECGKGEHLVE